MNQKNYFLRWFLVGVVLEWVIYFVYRAINPDSYYPHVSPVGIEYGIPSLIGYILFVILAAVTYALPFAVLGCIFSWIYGKFKNRNSIN